MHIFLLGTSILYSTNILKGITIILNGYNIATVWIDMATFITVAKVRYALVL